MTQALFFFGAGINFADTVTYDGKVKLVPLPRERKERG